MLSVVVAVAPADRVTLVGLNVWVNPVLTAVEKDTVPVNWSTLVTVIVEVEVLPGGTVEGFGSVIDIVIAVTLTSSSVTLAHVMVKL